MPISRKTNALSFKNQKKQNRVFYDGDIKLLIILNVIRDLGCLHQGIIKFMNQNLQNGISYVMSYL